MCDTLHYTLLKYTQHGSRSRQDARRRLTRRGLGANAWTAHVPTEPGHAGGTRLTTEVASPAGGHRDRMSMTRRRTNSLSTGSEVPQGTYSMKWPKSIDKLGVEFGPVTGPNSWPVIDHIEPGTHTAERVEEDRKHGRPYLVAGMKITEIIHAGNVRKLDTLPMADGVQVIEEMRGKGKEVELRFVDTVWQLHTGADGDNYCCGECNKTITGRRFRQRGEERNLCESCYGTLEPGDDLKKYQQFDGTEPHIAGDDGFLQRFQVLTDMSGSSWGERDTSVPTPPMTPENAHVRLVIALAGIEEGCPPEIVLDHYFDEHEPEPELEPEQDPSTLDPQWQANKDYRKCPMCSHPFSQKTRRHHCRKCGKIGCASCLEHKLPLLDRMTKDGTKALAKKKKQRVCETCFMKVPRELAALQTIGAFRDFAGMGNLDAVAEKLGEHIEDERLVSAGCTWLADLTIGDEDEGEDEGWRGLETSEAAHPPVKKLVLDVLLQALLRHPSVVHVQAECCRALANLGGSGIANAAANRELITASGGLAYVIKALRLHPSSAVVQEHGCNALSSLAHNTTKANKTSNKAVIESMGGVELGLTAIRNFSHSASVQTTACRMLEALMGTEIPDVGGYGGGEDHGTGPALTIVDGDIEVEDGRVESGIGVGLLLSVLQAHPADTEAQAAACAALAALGALRPARENQARRQNSANSGGAAGATDGDRPCVFSRVRRVLLTTTVPAVEANTEPPYSCPAADAATAFEHQSSEWPGKKSGDLGLAQQSDRDDEHDVGTAVTTQGEGSRTPAVELLALSVLGVPNPTIQAQGCQLLRALAGCLKPEIARQCIAAIYSQHAPEKLDKLDRLLFEWRGREALLLGNVEHKHCLYGGGDGGGAKVISGTAKFRQAVVTMPFFDADDEETPRIAEDLGPTGQQQPSPPKEVSKLPFPKKNRWGNWGNTAESVVAERQTALQVWLDAVLSLHPTDADLTEWLTLSSPHAARVAWRESETRQEDGSEYTIFKLEAFGLEDEDEAGSGSVLEKRYSDFCSLRHALVAKEKAAQGDSKGLPTAGAGGGEAEQVRLLFGAGALGINLTWGKPEDLPYPVVESIIPKTQADSHHKARVLSVGMKLLAVEGESLENKTSAEGGQIFKSHGRPVELTFSRPIASATASAGRNYIMEGVPPNSKQSAGVAALAAPTAGSSSGVGRRRGWGATEWAPDGRDYVLRCLRRALERKAVQTLDADGNLERVRPGQKAIHQLQLELNELIAEEQLGFGNAGMKMRPNTRIFVEGRGQGTVVRDGIPIQQSSTWSSALGGLMSIDSKGGGAGNGGNGKRGSNTKGLCHTVEFDLAEGRAELVNLSETNWGCGDRQIEEMEALQSQCIMDAMARKDTGNRLVEEGKYDEAQTNFEVGLTSARRTSNTDVQEELQGLMREVEEKVEKQAAGRKKR